MKTQVEIKKEIDRLNGVIKQLQSVDAKEYQLEILVNQACRDALVWSISK